MMKPSKELVLTGHPDFIPECEQDALFLAPWCFVDNSLRERQGELEVLPPVWLSVADLEKASVKLTDLYDRLVPVLASVLNRYYNVNYMERFWRVVTVTWATRWLHILCDRYLRLKTARETGFHLAVNIPAGSGLCPIRNYHQFACVMNSHEYNLSLMGSMLKALAWEDVQLCEQKVDIQFDDCASSRKLSRLKEFFKQVLFRIAPKSIYWGWVYGLNGFSRWLLMFRTPRFISGPQGWGCIEPVPEGRLPERLPFHANDEFEKLAGDLILQHMPSIILEGIPEVKPEYRVHTWVGNDVWQGEEWSLIIARIIQNGGRWISAQHGGSYGMLKVHMAAETECRSADAFITWGWSHQHVHPTRNISIPSPLLSRLPQHKQTNSSILLVGTAVTYYTSVLESYILPATQNQYLDIRCSFIKHLDPKTAGKVVMKPYPSGSGVDEKQYFDKHLDSTQFIDRHQCLSDLLGCCRLAVFDYPGTSALEAFAIGTPIVMFWDPAMFEMNDEAEADFDRLRQVEILHHDPESAAGFVNDNFGQIEHWWNSHEVLKAREAFARKYAWRDDSYLKYWSTLAKELSKDGRDIPEWPSQSILRSNDE